jgi:DivIVA domain-containing protein
MDAMATEPVDPPRSARRDVDASVTPQSFSRVRGLARGYDVAQVDTFLTRALGGSLTAAQVRSVGFDLVRGGYEVDAVDQALDRLEDELAAGERRAEQASLGERRFVSQVTSQAQVLRARLARPHGDRFARATAWAPAYDVSDVDELCDLVADYFDGVQALSVDGLRSAVFRSRRGSRGYSEAAVDAFLDRVVAVITRVS